jgi:RHS repeat-associated protein
MLISSLGYTNGVGTGQGLAVSRAYDRLNRLTSVSSKPYGSSAPSLPVGFQYQYNSANQRTRADLGDGTYWVYEYDALGQGTGGRRYWGDGTPVAGQDFTYAFDEIGNRQSTGGRASSVSTYANNRLNQITGRSVPPYVDVLGVGNPTANVTVRVIGGTTYTAARKGEYFHRALNVPNSTNVYPSIEVKSLHGATQAETNKVFVAAATESPTHDADGNLTQDGRWTYTWDGENRLVQMIRDTASPSGARQKLVFEYDHQGRRIRKTFSTYSGGWQEQSDLIFLYDGWNLVGEFDANSSNAMVRTYVWGTDLSGTTTGAGGVGGLLWLNNHQSTFEGKTLPTGVQYAAYDGNGNVAALVKAADGSVTARYDYGPFAEPIRASGPMDKVNPIRFSTKYTDYQSGLVYYGYRYYGPATGRWLSRDPTGERGGVNLYGFVRNTPLNLFDYLGLDASDKPCCDHPCDKEGATELTGEYASVLLPGEQNIGDPNVVDEMSKKIKKALWACKRQGSYVGQVGGVVLAITTKTAKDLEEYQNGIKLYTVLAYLICMKGHCGGLGGKIKQLRGTCSQYHWSPGNTEPRQCKPTGAEAHPLNPSAFQDRATAEGAAPRCQTEHADEFEHPEKYINK